MPKTLIIGAGGVGSVVAQKCARLPDVFGEILLASRTVAKCEAIADLCEHRPATARIDADNVPELVALMREFRPELVVNVALPYQDLHIMDACLEAGSHYLDTANYEPPDVARFEYHWQWAYHNRFRDAGLMAVLGCGFDPGVTSIFASHALKHHFDEIETIDIIDCNAGDHGRAFATNFNPEINIREVTANGRYFENGEWLETAPLSEFIDYEFNEGIGTKRAYLMYHEELESLARHIPGVRRLRFFMTFSEQYLNHLRVLEAVGMTSIKPINYAGMEIVPLQFLKAVLPEPGTLGPDTRGKTWIGDEIHGTRDGKPKDYRIYNTCDHQECYRDVKSQGVSYTTGVPAMIGAKLMLEGTWRDAGVFNVEQLDPDPFMADLPVFGLPWTEG